MNNIAKGLFSGIISDFNRRWPHYGQDFKDGFHPKSAASSLFLYFACLAPAVTFGGIMGIQTAGQIGAMEMLIASIFVGIAWALFSGQPLIIMGGTGPMLVFTVTLFQTCQAWNIPFLPTYVWVGLWSGAILIILAATNASNLMKAFTRFTDEIFAALISLIFVVESLKALVEIFIKGYTASQINHDLPLVTLLLALGTFQIAKSLTNMRKSIFLRPITRNLLADFGPAISIISMTCLFLWLKHLNPIGLLRLAVPNVIGPTLEVGGVTRNWLVNPFDGIPLWVPMAAIIPALLVVVLIFLDQNITARLVNSSDHKLTKGEAYHWDMGLLGVLIAICSLFGLPWLVAATVRSLNHVKSLATYKAVGSSDKEAGVEQIQSVRENRLTPLVIHSMLGASLLFLPYLQEVPMAVLYGIFLYMGVVSFGGNQFFERLSLWITDPELYPETHYMKKVPLWVINKFTLIQSLCLAILWIVKISPLGMVFPLFIALLAPLRLVMNKFFKEDHLALLDLEEFPDEEEDTWV